MTRTSLIEMALIAGVVAFSIIAAGAAMMEPGWTDRLGTHVSDMMTED